MTDVDLRLGDCLEIMPSITDASVDAIITDPPAGIGFMGKDWDRDKGGRDAWIRWLAVRLAECLRVAKPGARALIWAIPRTSHWTGTAIEDAGWIIEDRVSHLFGTGYPKAKSKLKPACEDWWLARKPSKNVPPLNIDDCRIATSERAKPPAFDSRIEGSSSRENYRMPNGGSGGGATSDLGRWPANLVLTCCGEDPHCDGCPVAAIDEQSGETKGDPVGRKPRASANGFGANFMDDVWRPSGTTETAGFLGSGGASRFFYCSKASKADRGDGNTHPTVKSTELMRWLCRLITPPRGTILDPFMGSGSTGLAAAELECGFIGIEKDPAYFEIARSRIAAVRAATPLLA